MRAEADRRDGTVSSLDAARASWLVAACEQAWSAIQAHHPEVPDAVIVLGTGVERGRLVKLGHWWGGRWLADGNVRGEVLLAGEALHLTAPEVFEVLLHEAAHGLNATRGIKDASRGGRYHNARFQAAATEVGLDVGQMRPYGWARTSLSSEGADRYAVAISGLSDAMRIARRLERHEPGRDGAETSDGGGAGGETNGKTSSTTASLCGCGRRMRMAPSVLAAGPVVCGLCGTEFAGRNVEVASRRGPRTPERANGVVDRSFVDRRKSALAAVPEPEPALPKPTQFPPDLFERVWSQLDAVRQAAEMAGLGMTPAVLALEERCERLGDLLMAMTGEDAALTERPRRALIDSEQRGIAELVAAGVQRGDEAIISWYSALNTRSEQPMLALSVDELDRRNGLARALLKADGTLVGPAVVVGRREFMAGDRVVSGPESDERTFVPPGVPGNVVGMDIDGGVLTVDFPTAGRFELDIKSRDAASLDYAYTVGIGVAESFDLRTIDLDTVKQAEVLRLGAEVEL